MNIIYKAIKNRREILALVMFIVIFTMPSFCIQTSDNDGSAFITKAEFDSLKNNFQSQIDSYNQGIDNKIDAAIASYLSGIRLAKTEERELLAGTQGKKLTFFNSNANQDLAYVYAPPRLSGSVIRTELADNLSGSARTYSGWSASTNTKAWAGISMLRANFDNNKSDFTRFSSKTAIDNLDQTKKIARWAGYYTDCLDEVVVYSRQEDFYYTSTIAGWDFDSFYRGQHPVICALLKNQDLYGKQLGQICNIQPDTGGNRSYTHLNCWSVIAGFGRQSTDIYASLYNFNYDMFSNMERNYNWGYDGTYQTTFDGYTNMSGFSASDTTDCFTNIYNEMIADNGIYELWSFYTKNYSLAPDGIYEKKYKKYTAAETGGKFFTVGNGTGGTTATSKQYIPMLGFERTYLTNWGQIYNEDFDNYITAGATSVITDSSGKKHMSMTNGVPFITLATGETLEYTFDFVDKTQDYWIWLKTSPFLNENKVLPGTNETTIDLIGAGAKSNGAYKIASGAGTIKYVNESGNEETLYLKFGAGDLDATTIKSGTLTLSKATVTLAD